MKINWKLICKVCSASKISMTLVTKFRVQWWHFCYTIPYYQVQQLHHWKASRGGQILQLDLLFPGSIQVRIKNVYLKTLQVNLFRQINRTVTEDEKIILYSPEYLKWGNKYIAKLKDDMWDNNETFHLEIVYSIKI